MNSPADERLVKLKQRNYQAHICFVCKEKVKPGREDAMFGIANNDWCHPECLQRLKVELCE